MRLHINFSVMTPLFAPIALELQTRHEVEACSGFVYGVDGLKEIQKYGLDTRAVRVLSQFLREFDEHAEPDMDFLRRKEREYGEPYLYPMIAGCRFVSQFPRRRALRVLEAGFRLVEGLFDEFRPDAVLSDGVACTMSYIQYVVAKKRGLPFIALSSSRITDRFYIIHGHLERYERVEALYTQYQGLGLAPHLRRKAEEFLRRFREEKGKPKYFTQWAVAPAVDLKSLRELARLTYRYYVLERGNYILTSPPRAVAGRVGRLVKTFLLDRRHFDQPSVGEKFVFFPLHYQPEASTLIWAPYYVDQIAAVENIAKTLPIDHVLYVKEHKGSLGRRPLGYYKRLRAIPNVRLISPYCDSHDLIQQCSAVCVLTSTVGWEAILYEKPVISLGEAFFNAFEPVRHVRAVADLPEAFRDAIDNFVPDRERLLKFIAANLEGLYEGDADYMPGVSSRQIEPDKIRRLSDVIADELRIPVLR